MEERQGWLAGASQSAAPAFPAVVCGRTLPQRALAAGASRTSRLFQPHAALSRRARRGRRAVRAQDRIPLHALGQRLADAARADLVLRMRTRRGGPRAAPEQV